MRIIIWRRRRRSKHLSCGCMKKKKKKQTGPVVAWILTNQDAESLTLTSLLFLAQVGDTGSRFWWLTVRLLRPPFLERPFPSDSHVRNESHITFFLRPRLLLFLLQCCFMCTEILRTISNGEPRTSTSTFTQLLSSGANTRLFNDTLRPQRPYGLFGTGSPGRPPRLSHSSWTLLPIIYIICFRTAPTCHCYRCYCYCYCHYCYQNDYTISIPIFPHWYVLWFLCT